MSLLLEPAGPFPPLGAPGIGSIGSSCDGRECEFEDCPEDEELLPPAFDLDLGLGEG